MIYPSGDKLEKVVESKYSLVVLAAKRAKQLREGAPKLIETSSTNPLTVALEEIAAGKVRYKLLEESEMLAMDAQRRAALDSFDELPAAAGEELLQAEEPAPSVQELLKIEGEETLVVEPEAEAAPQPSVAELLKVEDDEVVSAEAAEEDVAEAGEGASEE
ncbi:MAG: DNA-directed RNA polymerase subunit omega [Armatimonadota bacterium]|nr:DNA-directed RNA polymerase subunit omega [Armatimonadota bacterium]